MKSDCGILYGLLEVSGPFSNAKSISCSPRFWHVVNRHIGANQTLTFLGSITTMTSATKVRIPKQWMPLLRRSLARANPMLIKAFDDQNGPCEHLFVVSNKWASAFSQ